MFIRIFRPKKQEELLVNVNHVSKIEILYAQPGKEGELWRTSLKQGHTDTETVRLYRVHVADEILLLVANPNDPVVKIFDDIYKNAIKGEASKPKGRQ